MSKWQHIFAALARQDTNFLVYHSLLVTKRGLVFRTVTAIHRGYLFRQMFGVLPDGRIFGPRGQPVGEELLLAWLKDPKGLGDL